MQRKSSKITIYFVAILLLLLRLTLLAIVLWLLTPKFLHPNTTNELLISILILMIISNSIPDGNESPKRKCVNGYTQLYYKVLPHTNFGDKSAVRFIVLSILQAIIVVTGAIEEQISLVDSIVALIPSIFVILAILLIWPIIKIAFRLNLNPQSLVPQYVVQLLFLENQPYSQKKGLLYNDLEKLKSVAEIEQGSADWRANTVSIGFISGISLIVGVFQFLSPWDGSLRKTYPQVAMFLNSIYPDWGQYQWLLELLGVISMLAVFFWFIYLLARWILTIVNFVSSETPNRILILACQEAIYILEYFKLEKCQELSYAKRKQIAEQLGYKIVDRDTISAPECSNSIWVQENEANGFYLSPIDGPPKWRQVAERVFTIIKTSFDKLTMYVSRMMKQNKKIRRRR